MDDYRIEMMDTFSVIGQEIELTNFQQQNIQLSIQFWKQFNIELKKAYLSQHGNWLKYAFMERRDGKLFYFCSIPKGAVVPEGFRQKDIRAQEYLVVDHIGHMDKIYATYGKLYRDVLPASGYMAAQDDFLHLERYDHRFYWNSEDSVIEIWVPVKRISAKQGFRSLRHREAMAGS